jgi:hypothetical protein
MIDHTFTTREGKPATIRIPRSVDAWELYDLPGADEIAHLLTEALKASFEEAIRAYNRYSSRDLPTFPGDPNKFAAHRACEAAAKIFNEARYTDEAERVGAGDTEPRVTGYEAIRRFMRVWLADSTFYHEF